MRTFTPQQLRDIAIIGRHLTAMTKELNEVRTTEDEGRTWGHGMWADVLMIEVQTDANEPLGYFEAEDTWWNFIVEGEL